MNVTARAAAIAFIAAAAVPLGCAAPSPELRLDGGRIRASGLSPSEQGEGTLAVSVAGSDTPLFGEVWRDVAGSVCFEPRFPLQPGVEYRAIFSIGGRTVEKSFRLPPPAVREATVVRAVFPSRDVLPENLLKFYLHFSAPMSRREAYRRVALLDSAGKAVELPFLEIGEELWNRDATRLTLLFDPGRIKRGLKPREDSGPALEEGRSYTLVIDPGWPDAEGRPLAREFRKTFKVVAPDGKQPDVRAWTLVPPKAGSTDPLVVQFEEALDEAMLHRALAVIATTGKPLEGRIEVDRGETRWLFHPKSAWQAGEHSLVVDVVLEDLAGNSIERPFEVDAVRPVDRTVTTRTVSRTFQPAK